MKELNYKTNKKYEIKLAFVCLTYNEKVTSGMFYGKKNISSIESCLFDSIAIHDGNKRIIIKGKYPYNLKKIIDKEFDKRGIKLMRIKK